MLSSANDVNNIVIRRMLYRKLSTPSLVDLSKMVEALKWKSKVDEAIDVIEDILLSDEFSPRAVDSQIEKISMYSAIGDCIEYGKQRVCCIFKTHREYDELLKKYDFV
jgi:hypothetical protein